MVPSPWERRSFLRGMRQGGAVAREMSLGNQVRVGQCGATSRTCSSSSLSLHSVCASRLTGGNAYLHKARGQLCASASVPRSGQGGIQLAVRGLVGSKQVHLGFPESTPDQPDRLGMWGVVRVRWPHDWDSPGCEQRTVTWTAFDFREGEGGRAVTCGVIIYLPTGWCTRQPQCCPCGLTRACPTAVAGTAIRPDALPTALGSWCAKAVRALSRAPRLPACCM